jgi:protein gp37
MTAIEWTDKTWNIFVGCSKVSEGCRNCYAINQAYRNNAMAAKMPSPGRMRYYEGLTHKQDKRVDWTGLVRFVPEALELPLKWRKPRKIFVNSMSDLFHESVREEHLDQVFAVMALSPQHTYQILTKRPGRMLDYLRSAKNRVRIAAVDLGRMTNTEHEAIESCQWNWPLLNVWMGVTVENQKALDERARPLYNLHNMGWTTFYSAEPLLEAVELYLNHERVDWVIVGGESGPGSRAFYLDWARSIIQQCRSAKVRVFVKQLGSNAWDRCPPPTHLAELGLITESYCQLHLRSRKGNNMEEWPEQLRIREVMRA